MYLLDDGVRFILNEIERQEIDCDIVYYQSLAENDETTLYALCIQNLQSGAYQKKDGRVFVETLFSPVILPAEEARAKGYRILDVSDDLEELRGMYCD